MKIALVDDEQDCLNEMIQLCHDFGSHHLCDVETFPFTSGEEFLKSLDTNDFSVVFMDIYMKGTDGITTALKMREHHNMCILIFLTSSTDFMPAAFSCHAFEYITKPFSPQRVSDVLKDALQLLPPSTKYLEVCSDRKTVRIFLNTITTVITDAHYLNITLENGTVIRCRMTISQFIKQIGNDTRFITINKGIVVNADYILDFDNYCCILENGTKLPIRVRDRLKIEQEVSDYNFKMIRSYQRHKKDKPY